MRLNGNKSTLHSVKIPTQNKNGHVLKPGLDCGLWTVDYGLWTVDCGLWTVDCGLWTVDYGLWTVS